MCLRRLTRCSFAQSQFPTHRQTLAITALKKTHAGPLMVTRQEKKVTKCKTRRKGERRTSTNHFQWRVRQEGVCITRLAGLQRDEELTLVRVLPIVGHAEDSRSLVCQPRIKLVSEGFPTCEGALTSFTSPCWITALKHEVVNQGGGK